ncbi:putative ATP-dependent endonuclease of OLD family [Fusobacterium sp. PH5-7]|uniref:ATP-dependent nuclease n=1 Tax=Fusobacterium sp. PH5-7 TaxID=2940528 RepID=UPI0024748FC1|nr:AAA family ATPase [Fusobacterium sp. PH5-7]MDH6458047.1 putative ATP-dependent endonuclease of OLD family [Fusobacterium sp. PH5-7]
MKTQPYISHIHIKNFRNFHSVDFDLTEQQVFIGENAVGKSNLIFALRLILDLNLSEKERMLEESDFWEGLESPMDKGEEIRIELYLSNFEDNVNIVAQLTDATVMFNNKATLKLTYKFFRKDENSTEYSYVIFKGEDESRSFTYDDRKILNIRVIEAIRDVESEMRNSRTSPITQIIKQKYVISKDVLTKLSKELEEKGADTLHIGEISDLENRIHLLLNSMISFNTNELNITLKTINIDATRLLHALRPLINNRESVNTSLGVNNILFIALILLLIEDETIKTYLSNDLYNELIKIDNDKNIMKYYTKIDEADGYILNLDNLNDKELKEKLYSFFSNSIPSHHGATILVVEEPEAHLHPIYQRLLYKHIINKSDTSVIITTHSSHISSAAPITSLVHLIATSNGTDVKTTASLELTESDFTDLSRYIDTKRGEIYTAKGVLLVEGISEEYLVTSFSECMKLELDRLGVIVCNINSTNFTPYCRFLQALGIPYVVITDGDYYHYEEKSKIFGDIFSETHTNYAYDGIDRMSQMCQQYINSHCNNFCNLSINEQKEFFKKVGIFIGEYTFEVDIFKQANQEDKNIISSLFNQLTNGGETQKKNFRDNLDNGDYYKCLSQIESSHSRIGKGRFAQQLADKVTDTMIPQYIKDAINRIACKVRG